MADNRVEYGFRWSTSYNGSAMPPPIEVTVASGKAFSVTGGASNVDLGAGDPVKRESDGHVTLCEGNETTPAAPYAIVMGVDAHWDGTVMKRDTILPSNITYGSNLSRQSKLLVVPVTAGAWEIDVDDSTTATDLSSYQAFIGENVDHILTGASGDSRAKPQLDISTHATTATLHWRLIAVSKTVNNEDFSGANVKLIVRPNVAQDPAYNATGV